MKRTLLLCYMLFTVSMATNLFAQVSFVANPQNGCKPLTVTFTNTSVDGNYYKWYFGDGDSSTVKDPVHIYTSVGNYWVMMEAYDTTGGSFSFKGNFNTSIDVFGSQLYSSTDTACPGEQISFYIWPQGNNYNWDFGDGQTSTESNPQHSYSSLGSYTVTLTANSSCGPDTFSMVVAIVPGSTPSSLFYIDYSPTCPNDPVRFNPQNFNLQTYTWNFGDTASGVNNTSNNNQPQHVYPTPGDYIVTLTVTSSCGTSSSSSDTVHVKNGIYMPNWINMDMPYPDPSCPNEPVTFNTNYSVASSYKWYFGDGDSANTRNTTHAYSSIGTKTVTLVMANGCGNDTTLYATVNISSTQPFTNGFLYATDSVCPGDNVNFFSSNAVSHLWMFGDGDSSIVQNPVHQYGSTGTYSVSLTMVNGCGGDTTIFWTIAVDSNLIPNLGGNFGAPSMTGCPGDTMIFYSQGGASYIWYFGDGDSTTQTTPLFVPGPGIIDIAKHVFADTGSYTIILKYFNNCGNYDIDSLTVTINNGEPVNGGFAPFTDPAYACQPVDFYAIGGTIYEWDFGDGSKDTTNGYATHAYSTPGTYNILLKITNGCGNTATIGEMIDIIPIPTPTVSVNGNLFTSSSAVSYQWYRDSLAIPGATSPTFTVTMSGMYKVMVTDSNGCNAFSNYVCYAQVNAGTDAFVCSGGSAQLNAIGGNATYTWLPSTGLSDTTIANPIANPTVTTTYSVYVSVGSCGAMDTVNVSVAGALVANAGIDTSICIGKGIMLNGSGGGTYAWSPSIGLNDTTVNNPVANPTVNTTYVLTVSSGLCSDSDTIMITVNSLPTVTASTDDTICFGKSTQLNATGASSYLWMPSSGLSSNSIDNPIASPAFTTLYKVIGTDSNGCSAMDSVAVLVNPLPMANAGMDDTICFGSSAGLRATGGSMYLWSPADGLNSTTIDKPTASPTVTTMYYVTVTDNNSCSAIDSVTVNVNPLPLANAGADDTICFGSSTTLIATGGASYSWSPADGLNATNLDKVNASPTVTTTYVVTVTSFNGCSATDTVRVVVNPLPVADAGTNDTICSGSSVNLMASGGNTYQWSPSTGLNDSTIYNPIASPAVTTKYAVSVTDNNGCEAMDSVTIVVNSLPTADAGSNDTICEGESAGLLATGGGTYLWSPATGLNSTTIDKPTATPSVTTTYIVTVTDNNGCTAVDSVTVVVKPLPVANAGPDGFICSGGTAQLNASGGGTYSWSPSTGLSATNIANPVATPTINITYVVTVDLNGCFDTDTLNVNVDSSLTANAGMDTSVCIGSSIMLSGSGGGNYAWSPSTGLSDTTIYNPMASPTVTITYVLVVSSGLCTDTDSVVVSVHSLPTADAGTNDTICNGESSQLNASGGVSYVWSPSTGLSAMNIANPIASPAISTTYVVTVANANGCTDTDSVTIIVNSLPVVNAGMDDTICEGASTSLLVTGGSSYVWSPASGLDSTTIANPTASPLLTTTYIVTVTDSNGCSAMDSVTVVVNTLPVANAGADSSICFGNNTILNGSGGGSYLWSPSAGLSAINIANPIASPTATTTYSLTVTNAGGCTDTDEVTVTVNALPTALAGTDTTICSGNSVTLNGSGGVSYLWSPSTGLSAANVANPIATPATTTTYILTVTSADGCTDTDAVTVTVNPTPVAIAGPDAFICGGGTAQLNATGGGTYSWSPSTDLSASNIANPVASPTSNTTYILTVDLNGCMDTDTLNVNVATSLTANAGIDTAVCIGSSITLNASGGGNYSWSPSTGLSDTAIYNPVASPTVMTTYVLVVSSGSCNDTDSVVVSIHSLPTADAGANDTICVGESAQLNATGGVSYAWAPSTGLSATNIANPMANPTATTSYVVTVTNVNACTNTDTVTIVVNPLPSVDAGNNTSICMGDTTTLNGTGVGTFQWSPSAGLSSTSIAGPSSYPASTTVYTLLLTDANGCSASDSVTINVIPLPIADAGTDASVCAGGSAQLNASGGTSYSWSPSTGLSANNIANPIASPAVTTTYIVTVTKNGCSDTDTVDVVLTSSLTANAGVDDTICAGESISLIGTGGGNYLWSPSTGLDNDAIYNPIATPDSTTTYVLTVSSGSCSDEDTVSIVVNTLPIVSFTLIDTLCVTDAGITLAGTPSGGTYSGNGVTGNVFDPASAGNGSHTITYVYVDPTTLCSDSVSEVIVVDPCTGIKEESKYVLHIYPNPTSGDLNISSYSDGLLIVQLFDISGNILYTEKHPQFKGEYKQVIHMNEMARGVYFLRVITDKGTKNTKIVLN